MTQYLFCIMRQPNLPVLLILYVSHIIPVYISHICGRHHLELYGDVPVIIRKGRVQEASPYHLGDVIIVSQNRNDFVILPLGLRIAQNVKDRIRFPRDLEGYPSLVGYI